MLTMTSSLIVKAESEKKEDMPIFCSTLIRDLYFSSNYE